MSEGGTVRVELGWVNAYLVPVPDGFVLVDTGRRATRKRLLATLAAAGCTPANLRLIVLTHGDSDHTGSAAFLHREWHAPLAMHELDVPMLAQGDMLASRPHVTGWRRGVLGGLMNLMGPKGDDRARPDVLLGDGRRLDEWGWAATAYSLPGHSEGSLGIITDGGDFFCGDLLENRSRPSIGSIRDSLEEMRASARRALELGAKTAYPGHGRPFPMSELKDVGPASDSH